MPNHYNIGGAIVPSLKAAINLKGLHRACTGFKRIRKACVHSSTHAAGIVNKTNKSSIVMKFGLHAN